MKTALICIVAFLPLIGYILFTMFTRIPDSGIDYVQILISMVLGFVCYSLAEYLLKKQK